MQHILCQVHSLYFLILLPSIELTCVFPLSWIFPISHFQNISQPSLSKSHRQHKVYSSRSLPRPSIKGINVSVNSESLMISAAWAADIESCMGNVRRTPHVFSCEYKTVNVAPSGGSCPSNNLTGLIHRMPYDQCCMGCGYSSEGSIPLKLHRQCEAHSSCVFLCVKSQILVKNLLTFTTTRRAAVFSCE